MCKPWSIFKLPVRCWMWWEDMPLRMAQIETIISASKVHRNTHHPRPASSSRNHWYSGNHHHLPPEFISLRKDEPIPEMSPQTPVSGYSWPRRTQVADKVVSPSCFRSSLPYCPFSWCPLCHSFCSSVVFESCNVFRPSMYFLLDNVYDIIYTGLMSYPVITFVVA